MGETAVPDDRAWRDAILELLGAWPGRFDEMTATAYVHSLQGRGATDPQAVLRALRTVRAEHPPSAGTLAALVLRDGQPDAPSFDAVLAYVARTIATHTRSGDDALAAFVSLVATELHEAPARWVAQIGMSALREVPDPRFSLDTGQRIRLRDHERGYAEQVSGWLDRPARGVAVEMAVSRDALAGREVPEALRVVREAPQIGPGA